MITKVTLDTLDTEEPTISPAEEHLDEESPQESLPGKVPRRWYRSRLFLISGVTLFVICCAGLFLFFFRGAKKEVRHTPTPGQHVARQSTSAPPSAPPVAGVASVDEVKAAGPSRLISVEMKDFLIPLKDAGKSHEVLTLEVTVQIDSSQQALFNAKIALTRGGIYKALHDMTADIPRGKGGMAKVREKITVELGSSLGNGFVKDVWISKFIVL
jgi:flagellar basal body-associated protein FliL